MSSMKQYLSLPIPDNVVIATYVWNIGEDIKSKDKTVYHYNGIESLPHWSFDGYSTDLTSVHESDIKLIPQRIYKNPFIQGKHIIVLCETYDYSNRPTDANTRYSCVDVCKKTRSHFPQFGIEQEYYLIENENDPTAIKKNHYCGLGLSNRSLIDAHYFCCLYAGINIYGTNAENGNNQWEFQLGPTDNETFLGPSDAIKICDDLWIARYLLLRLAEEYGINVSFKVFPSEISPKNPSSGGHFNFSTQTMRIPKGITEINSAIEKLSVTHGESIKHYAPKHDSSNIKRLSGKGETSKYDHFTHGIGDRTASVRIPIQVKINGKGYLEDRRPASNCDPYQVVESILRSTLLTSSDI